MINHCEPNELCPKTLFFVYLYKLIRNFFTTKFYVFHFETPLLDYQPVNYAKRKLVVEFCLVQAALPDVAIYRIFRNFLLIKQHLSHQWY